MALHKSVQYSIFCDNYITCCNFEDYADLPEGYTAQQYFRAIGYTKKGDKWYCPECSGNERKEPPKDKDPALKSVNVFELIDKKRGNNTP